MEAALYKERVKAKKYSEELVTSIGIVEELDQAAGSPCQSC